MEVSYIEMPSGYIEVVTVYHAMKRRGITKRVSYIKTNDGKYINKGISYEVYIRLRYREDALNILSKSREYLVEKYPKLNDIYKFVWFENR